MPLRRLTVFALAGFVLLAGCSLAPIITTQVERSVLTEVFSTTE